MKLVKTQGKVMNNLLDQCRIEYHQNLKITVIGIGKEAGRVVSTLSIYWFDAECFSIYDPKTCEGYMHPPNLNSYKDLIQIIQPSHWVIIASAFESDNEKLYFAEIAALCKKLGFCTTGIIPNANNTPASVGSREVIEASAMVDSLLVISPTSIGKIQLHSGCPQEDKKWLYKTFRHTIRMLVHFVTRQTLIAVDPPDMFQVLKTGKVGYIGVGTSSIRNTHSANKAAIKQAFQALKKQGVSTSQISAALLCFESKDLFIPELGPVNQILNPNCNILYSCLDAKRKKPLVSIVAMSIV